RIRQTRSKRDWSSDVCSSDLSSVPSAFAGSSNPQCHLVTCGGVIGQLSFASPHNVITRSALFKTSRSMRSDVCVEISTSTSFIAFTSLGFSPCASIPALRTCHASPRYFLPQPSAIWLRHELPVHKKYSVFFDIIKIPFFCVLL